MPATMTEIHEGHLRWSILAVFLFALKYLLDALALTFEDTAAGLERAAQIAALLSAIVIVATVMVSLLRQTRLLLRLTGPADLRLRGRLHEDGYTFYAIRIAAWISLVVTGIAMVVLETIAWDSSLPPAFFLQISLFMLGASFSLAFAIIDFWPARGQPE